MRTLNLVIVGSLDFVPRTIGNPRSLQEMRDVIIFIAQTGGSVSVRRMDWEGV